MRNAMLAIWHVAGDKAAGGGSSPARQYLQISLRLRAGASPPVDCSLHMIGRAWPPSASGTGAYAHQSARCFGEKRRMRFSGIDREFISGWRTDARKAICA